MRAAHERWGADAASLESIATLGEARTRVVVTGQQPGLLVGPLYIVHKMLGAIVLARRLAERHPDLRFVPVFWVASEDHDFDEIRRAFWPGNAGQLEEFLLHVDHWKTGQMIGGIPTGDLIKPLTESIVETTYETEYRPDVIERIGQFFGGDADLETGFCRLALSMLAGTGLVMVSPLMKWVRRRAAAAIARELEEPGHSTQLVIARGEKFKAAGLETPVHRAAGAINAFWIDADRRRYALHWKADRVHRTLAGSIGGDEGSEQATDQQPLSLERIQQMLADDPEQFSANVVTRPVVQDTILPTVAQVVGPGEAAYLAQVECVYDRFGAFAPVRWPRPQITLVEPRVERQLEKYQVELTAALDRDAEELSDLVLKREMDRGILRDLHEAHTRHRDELDRLRGEIENGDPSIDRAFEKLEQLMRKGYETIGERILYQRRQDERHVLQAMMTVVNSLRPAEAPQERRLNPVVPFAVNYGSDWVLRLLDRIAIDAETPMQIVRMTELK